MASGLKRARPAEVARKRANERVAAVATKGKRNRQWDFLKTRAQLVKARERDLFSINHKTRSGMGKWGTRADSLQPHQVWLT